MNNREVERWLAIFSNIGYTDLNCVFDMIDDCIPYNVLVNAPEDELRQLYEYYKHGKEHLRVVPSYDIRYLHLAKEYSTWSLDPSTQVGAVAIRDKRVLSTGYNGFSRKIKDDWRLYIRSEKYKHIVHAEMNVIYNATDNGVSLRDSTLYVYGLCVCSDCANGIIQAGIKRVVMCPNSNRNADWRKSNNEAFSKFEEAEISYNIIENF